MTRPSARGHQRRTRLAVVGAVVAGLAAASAGAVRADGPSDADVALSIDLFAKARKSSDAGGCKAAPVSDAALCREARDLFRRAYKLNPAGLGALKGQAQVEDALGLVASATRHYRELAMKAASDPSAEKRAWAKPAQEAAARLEPRVPHLTLAVPAGAPKDLRVTVDDDAIAEAAWNVPFDVDPGAHVLRATGTSVAPFTAEIVLAERETKTVTVTLAKIEAPAPAPGTSAAPPASASARASAPPPEKPPPTPAKGPDRTLPLVTLGVGVASVGVGLGLGWLAKSKRDDHCDAATKLCDSADALSSAKGLANGATVVTVIGSALVVAGVVWFVATPSGKSPEAAWVAPAALPGGGGVVVGGSFR